MIKSISFDELLGLVSKYAQTDVLITFHSIGDRDAVGSAVALSEYMQNSIVAMPDFLTNNAKHMLASVDYEHKISAKFVNTSAVIITDADNTSVLGPFSKELLNYSGEVLFIDHHLKSNDVVSELPKASAVYLFTDEKFNSTSSIIYALLKRLGAKIGKEVALLLANGITADSADLQNADALTFMQLSELFSISGTTYATLQEMYHENIPLTNRLMTMQDVKNANLESTGKYLLVFGKATEHANVAADTAMNMGADAAVFWSVTPYEASISGRLRSPLNKKLNVHLGVYMHEIASLLNGTGGGHACAAGAYGPEKGRVEEAAMHIVNKLREALK
ncbi:MAG: DHH family phosphoesterase [Candidatus Micrarchaeaceae archaeon]